MTKTSPPHPPSRGARLKGYFLRRIRPETSAQAARGLLREGWVRSIGGIQWKDISLRRLREAWEAQIDQEAEARFSEVMQRQRLAPSDLERSVRIHRVIAVLFGLAAVVSFSLGLILIIMARDFTWIASGLPLSLAAFVFLALAARHAHIRWQIETRSLGSFRKWLGRSEK